jgi:hypothetical protein
MNDVYEIPWDKYPWANWFAQDGHDAEPGAKGECYLFANQPELDPPGSTCTARFVESHNQS